MNIPTISHGVVGETVRFYYLITKFTIMKRFLIILSLFLMLFSSFGRKVIVLEVTKEGSGWQNIFNMYAEVNTTYVGDRDGVPCATLTCRGNGYSFCRASREIGVHEYFSSISPTGRTVDVLSNVQIVNAINELLEASEKAFVQKGKSNSACKKVAITNQNSKKCDLYIVKAVWQYNTKNETAKIIISIDLDESNILSTH